jgi:hypothetical protein
LAAGSLVAALFLALPARGQFAQYTPPGGGGGEPENRKARLEEAVSEARWRLGPVRLDPWLGLSDVGYVRDQAGGEARAERRVTASAGAGLRAYLPTGPKVVWAAHLLPEYTWAEDEAASRANGRYGAGLFAYFNRLTLEATATRIEQLSIVSPEVLARSNARGDQLALSAELQVRGSLYLLAGASRAELEHLVEPGQAASVQALDDLDREENVSRLGLRFETRGGWRVGLGAEWSEVDFATAAADRSNSGVAPTLEIERPEGRLRLALAVAWRSLEPEGEARFVPFEGPTGTLRVAFGEGRRLAPALYARRNVVYALGEVFSHFESDRAGLSLGSTLGRRVTLVAFGEAGRDRYEPVEPGALRRDDQQAYGLTLEIPLGRSLALSLGASRESYESSDPAADREFTAVRAGLRLSGGPSPWY